MLDRIPKNNLINGMLVNSGKKFHGNILVTTAVYHEDIDSSQVKEIEERTLLLVFVSFREHALTFCRFLASLAT